MKELFAGWFPLALVAAILYGLHNVFTRLASGKIDDYLGGLVLESTATLGIALYILYLYGREATTLEWTRSGIGYSMLAGICVGLGTVLFFVLFRIGAPLSTAGPIVLAGGIALMSVAGCLLFKEPFNVYKALGLAFTLAGTVLLKSSS